MVRSRASIVLGTTVLTAALVWCLAPSAGASGGAGPSTSGVGRALTPSTGLDVLYSQLDNDSGVGIVSQNFTDAGFDIYDSGGADDFVVPSGETWTVQGVDVIGVYFNGPGPADSETVRFYQDAGGHPGALITEIDGLTAPETGGSFVIDLGGAGPVLTEGTYWVGMRVTMPFTPAGEWGWETRTVQSNTAAVWRNGPDGFATGCTKFHEMQQCIGPSGEGPDFMFAIEGISS